MSTPPLTRDQQIEMMKGTRDRRAAILERWSKDEDIQRMFRQSVKHSDAHALEQMDEYLMLRRA